MARDPQRAHRVAGRDSHLVKAVHDGRRSRLCMRALPGRPPRAWAAPMHALHSLEVARVANARTLHEHRLGGAEPMRVLRLAVLRLA